MSRYWPFINPFVEQSTELPLLREVFEDWKIGYGIFEALEELEVELPWADKADSIILDIEYFGNRSGAKLPAPIVMNLLGDTEALTYESRIILANIIWTKFGEPWKRLWETNVVAYNPIHNYNMTDTRKLAKGESEAKVGESSSVDTTQHGRSIEGVDYTFGLNSTGKDGKRSNRSVTQEGGSTVDTVNETQKDDSVRAVNEEETTNRSGNIGVTTTQQMLSAERELWMWNFFDQVYKDIDSVLALPFYDPCRV